ncbi:hypothetical protein ACQR2B_17475 [Bradyrhizobium oligotrophicum]|uniref:hypothetical protein n=1 Tax=Bradyrhizobium TaxID=374 RepID=UPI003EBEC21B
MVSNLSLPKPKDWQDFERKTCALFARILGDPNTQMHGRTGQSQRGVDIWGYRNQDSRRLVGVQCKLSADPITVTELEAELEKAKTFRPPISEFFLVSTAPRDVKLQQRTRELTSDLAATDHPIVVCIWGWEDVEESASRYGDAWTLFDPTYNPFAVEAHRETLRKLNTIDAELRRSQATSTHFGNTHLLLPVPSSFDGKVKEFNDEYLATDAEQAAIPFGGRDRDLRMLDEWLGDNESAPRFLLVGPAGRGKSALLVHWIAHLRATKRIECGENRLQLVFFPISMRFATHLPNVFYQALAVRLNDIVRGKLRTPAEGTDAASYYQDQCRELLGLAIKQGIRILVIVDGVDEALGGRFDANWFPRATGTCVRILVSARLQIGDHDAIGWLERLNWIGRVRAETHLLPTLKREDLLDLALHGGEALKRLAMRREFVDRLVNLTKGEPLLVRLYVEDLSKRSSEKDRLTVDDLASIEPGFGPYFRDWLERQHEAWQQEYHGHSYDQNTLQAYLCVLACAYGPLPSHELNEVAKSIYPIARAFSVQTALRPLRRFIIGSDKHSPIGGPGYTLSHPKLGEFLRDEYFDQERVRETREAFVAWGRSILDRTKVATFSHDVPQYVLQYLGQHFEDTNFAADDYMNFVEENWMRAWEHFEGGYHGFSQDVYRADRIVMKSDSSRFKWARRVRCQLVLSSIGTAGSRIPSTLIIALFKSHAITEVQALRLVNSQAEYRRLETIVGLAPLLSPTSCEEALQIAGRIGSGTIRARALAILASRVSEPERERAFEQSLEAIERITPEWELSETFSTIVPHLPASLLSRAFTLARSIVGAEDRAAAILSLVPHLAPQDQVALINEIKATVCSATWGYSRHRGLLPYVVPQMSSAARSALIGEWILRSILPDPTTLSASAPFLEQDELKALTKIANRLKDAAKRAISLAALSGALPEATRIDTLRESLCLIRKLQPVPPVFDMFGGNPGCDGRADALCAVAPFLADELHEEALSIACSIPTESARINDNRIDALLGLIPVLTGNPRMEATAHALELARSGRHRSGLNIARLISWSAIDQRQELVQEVLALMGNRHDWFGGERVKAIRLISSHLSASLVDLVLSACRAIEHSDERTEALAAVLPYLPPSRLAFASREALSNARLIDDKQVEGEILAAISALLTQATAESTIDKKMMMVDYRSSSALSAGVGLAEDAMTAARAIAMFNSAPEHFSSLVPLLPAEKRVVVVKEALAAVGKGVRGHQANAMRAIAPHLPPTLVENALSVLDEFFDSDERGIAMAWLLPHLPEPLQIEALSSFISQASQMTRPQLLRALKPVCPLIAQIGGRESLLEVRRAICDVRDWFP